MVKDKLKSYRFPFVVTPMTVLLHEGLLWCNCTATATVVSYEFSTKPPLRNRSPISRECFLSCSAVSPCVDG